MHLRALTMKGFKSFPDRTRLDFGPGVSVVVGPNGSGKSNVTDAVLWAMGEQSPLAVRGQAMQDVIFGGGRGVAARSAAEVEIVLENSDGRVDLPLSEISIVRRLDRSGEGEYRLNGARCRLADVLEVLSDTGLGKESHSVISQGRVEAIVMSKPRERRMLIEEAAGLGKHRRRRRRAQLKLTRTEENLARALEREQEARARLRPLKRQSEAAELHARLQQQSLEARLRLAGEAARSRRLLLADAQRHVQEAHAARAEVEERLREVGERRAEAERALSARAEQRDELSGRLYRARTAEERLQMRLEQVETVQRTLRGRIAEAERELEALRAHEAGAGDGDGEVEARLRELERELGELEAEQEQATERELAEISAQRDEAAERVAAVEARRGAARAERQRADERADLAREGLREAEREAQASRRRAAEVGAELAAANQFLRRSARVPGGAAEIIGRAASSLGQLLSVEEGCELALSAALGRRLEALLVSDMREAERLLDAFGADGGSVLLAGHAARGQERPGAGESRSAEAEADPEADPESEQRSGEGGVGTPAAAAGSAAFASPLAPAAVRPPVPGARPLAELIGGPEPVCELAGGLLADTWLIDEIAALPDGFEGVAVTRSGRLFRARTGEVVQVAEGGAERALAKRNERDRLVAETERVAREEHAAQGRVQEAAGVLQQADAAREMAERELRAAERELGEAREQVRRLEWVAEQRRQVPGEGPLAVRRAQLAGEIELERRQAERIGREREERRLMIAQREHRHAADGALVPAAQRLGEAVRGALDAAGEHRRALEALLVSDREAGETLAQRLRECAAQEAEIQARLRARGEAVTAAEVAAQRLRDQAQEAELELRTVAESLQIEPPEPDGLEVVSEQEQEELDARLQRLTRRREQLGPVNPLAQEEYAEALAHVQELEERRLDLETALRELRSVIRETDRQIRETFQETFAAAARNFEELAGEVFPGGRGRLRLVSEREGGEAIAAAAAAAGGGEAGGEERADAEAEADAETEREGGGEQEDLEGVEIEITPEGKAMKRLSLLSGGEKSMTALAFLFAVFLARPCPFYILDEVEAALDDLNLERFLSLLRRYSGAAQFIVITHQKRTMEAADWLYGVSMGGDGVSKVISRRLPPSAEPVEGAEPAGAAEAGAGEQGAAAVAELEAA